ncbi:MAG: AbgT family transporter [Prevotella sp.]|nr:AbgT family transporter [Prevotella sp.]
MRTKWFGVVCATLIVGELVLVLVSWLLSATLTEGVRSLLSSEGVRWFFSNFTTILGRPLLVWLLLALMAAGCLQQSGLVSFLSARSGRQQRPAKARPLASRERIGFRLALAFLIIYIGVIALLTVVPHAVLLSATGQLFPSPFSRSLVPVVCFGVVLVSGSYGLMAGRFQSFTDLLHALALGIARGAWLLILYVLLIQFYESFRFVFA